MNKTSLLLLVGGLATGIGGAIGLQVYAQQTPTVAPVVHAPQPPAATPSINQHSLKADTDNIQDPGGKEQPDAPTQTPGDADSIQDPGGVEIPDNVKAAPAGHGKVAPGKRDQGEKEDSGTETGSPDGENAGD